MANTKREEAQRRRAESRQRRRGQASDEAKSSSSGNEQSNADEPLESVKQAAKVAAAAAAVGAAVGAARAIAGNGEDKHDEPERAEPTGEQEQPEERPEERPEPAGEQEQPQPVQEREPEPQQEEEPERERAPRRSGASTSEAKQVVQSAREQLAALLDKDPDSVSGLERNGDGWLVTLEVVELSRIPESTDVLASYELELDGDRNLVRYQRARRYYRSQADDGTAP